MILEGAKKYWGRPESVQELLDTWKEIGLDPILQTVRERFMELQHIQTVVDLGCGTGRIYSLLRDQAFKRYTAVDQSGMMIEAMSDRYEDDPRLFFEVRDISAMTLSADVILCIEVLQHQSDPLGELNILLSESRYNHFITTLLVGAERKLHDLPDGPGSLVVGLNELTFEYEPTLTTQIGETWVMRFDADRLSNANLPTTHAVRFPF